jgi:uncharacterized membrane protein
MATLAARLLPRQNVGNIERWASLLTGGILVAGGVTSKSPLAQIIGVVAGGALLWRGATGNCPLYAAAGIDTAHEPGPATAVRAGHGCKVDESITVNAPPRELYHFWRDFTRLPEIMSHVKEVRGLGGNRWHWVAQGPLGVNAEWDADVINEKEHELIAWKSVEGSRVDTAGSVHFTPAPGGGTEVRVTLKYDPPGGRTGATLAWLAGASPQKMIREDLERFRALMEAGEAPTAGRRAPAMATA